MTFIQAFIRNSGSPHQLLRERHKQTVSGKAYSIDADEDDGCRCSSVEVAVMAMERRTTDT